MDSIPPLIKQIVCKNDNQLLEIENDVNNKCHNRISPIEYAIMLGKPNFCKQLITAGVDIHTEIDFVLLQLNSQYARVFEMNVIQYHEIPEYKQQVDECFEVAIQTCAFTRLHCTPHILKLQLKIAEQRQYNIIDLDQFLATNKNITCFKIILSSTFLMNEWNRKIPKPAQNFITMCLNTIFVENRSSIQIVTFCIFMGLLRVSKKNTGRRVFGKLRFLY